MEMKKSIILTDFEAAVSIWSFASFLGGDRIRTCNLQVMSLMSRPIPLPRLFPLSFFHYGHLALVAWPTSKALAAKRVL
jgi:hypothetical protein